jgi:hypothetical protein
MGTTTPAPRQVALDFTGVGGTSERRDVSAVTAAGEHLWIGTDEGTHLVRLTRVAADRWGDAVAVPLDTLLTLPGAADDEVDVEGLDASDGWLWVVGSHSVRRRRPEPEDSPEQRMECLATTRRKGNRHLLARLPLVPDGGVVRDTVDADGATRRAARLRGGRARDVLTRALREDPHLAPFLDIPGKDNGFDVEGLAVDGTRCWLGLRGPVLRGFAVVLAVEPRPARAGDDALRLRRCGPDGRRYEKFFLDLSGLGVRELCLHGDDLLILAGPTMQLDGRAVVLRWRGARHARGDAIVDRSALEVVFDLPYGRGADEGVEHPEGIALIGDARPALLVVHDAPDARRLQGDALLADAYPLA